MCDRDDCSSLGGRKSGETIVCAFLVRSNPAIIRDCTGVYQLKSHLPSGSIIEVDGLYLLHFYFDNTTGSETCTRMTPIPPVLYGVYQKILEEFRETRNHSMK